MYLHFSSLLLPAMAKGPSGENSMSSPFLSVFQLISRLTCAGLHIQWQSAVAVSYFITSGGKDLCGGSKHPSIADELFQF